MKRKVRAEFNFSQVNGQHGVLDQSIKSQQSGDVIRDDANSAQSQANRPTAIAAAELDEALDRKIAHDARNARGANINTIIHWPALERPREKLCAIGAVALSDAELLAIFLRTGVRGQSAVDLGRTLLKRFGSLRALLSASAANLKTVRGMGAAKIAQLHAVGELAQRALIEEMQQSTCFDTPTAVRDYLKLLIGTRSYEVFVCLYLDARYRLICAKEVSHGTLTQTAVYPREIAKEALALNAAALIVAHNHPSGATQPSAADQQLTQQLQTSLNLFDIKLLDHFVIASNTIFSFSEQGWL